MSDASSFFGCFRGRVRAHLIVLILVAPLASLPAQGQILPPASGGTDPCKVEVSKDELIGKLPGLDPGAGDDGSILRARARARLEFAPESRMSVSVLPMVFAAGQMIEPKDMDKALKGLAKGRESLQYCRVSLAMSGRKQGDTLDLSLLTIRPAGTLHNATEYSVNVGGRTVSRFKNARARSMWKNSRNEPFFSLTIDCENYRGDEALTYRTIEESLGFKLRYYSERPDQECRVAVDTAQALSRAAKILPLPSVGDSAKATQRESKPPMSPVQVDSAGANRGRASRAE